MTNGDAQARRRRANGEESRQKILQAATEIATERGYEGTSIGAVSQRSGLPASSIYWHFKDKDALLAAVIEHSFGLWLAGAGGFSPRPESESVEQRLTAMMERTLKSLHESADFLRLGLMLALERREQEPSARKMFLSVREEALRRTIASYTELLPDLGADATRRLGALTMAMADGLFVAREIDGEGTDIAVEAEVLTAALLAAAQHLASRGSTGKRSTRR